MKLALALGIAAASVAFAAFAETADHPMQQRVFINGGMDMGDADANHDGWLSRDEAAAAADRMFAHLDTNHDGKLDQNDMSAMATHFEMHREGGGGENGDMVIRMGDGQNVHVEHGDNVHVETSNNGNTRTIVITRDGDGDAHGDHATPSGHDGDAHTQTIERNVTIVRSGDGDHDGDHGGAHEMHMMHGPMMAMMLFANSEEMDVNGDGAVSQEEFRNQQLRFFDASDVNGDHRIRFHTPPMPPAPSAPPPPPQAH